MASLPVILTDANIPYLQDALSPCGIVKPFSGRELSNDFILDSGASYIFARSTSKINKALLQGSNVIFVATATSGIDHVDINFLKQQNIFFASAPGSNANSVAEYVIYSILQWADINNVDISTKTIGIIGFGHVGSRVARYASLLEIKLLVNDPPLLSKGFSFPDYCTYASLSELISASDIITNHVPLDYDSAYPTNNLINQSNFVLLREDALFIHTSRGKVVDEDLMMRLAIEKNTTLVVDVWNDEPSFNIELANRAMIATPHIAGYSRDGKLRGAKACLNAFSDFSGLIPDTNTINMELNKYKSLDLINYKNPAHIRKLLAESRSIESDVTQFKALIGQSEEQRKTNFDLLRKNYPIRREIL